MEFFYWIEQMAHFLHVTLYLHRGHVLNNSEENKNTEKTLKLWFLPDLLFVTVRMSWFLVVFKVLFAHT